MTRTYAITVRGKSGAEYSFNFKGQPEHLEGWLQEGFEINELLNSIPVWAQQIGLTRPWCAVQDAWNWIRLW